MNTPILFPLLLLLLLVPLVLASHKFVSPVSPQARCPNQCRRFRSSVRRSCTNSAFRRNNCQVQRCTRFNGFRGFTCTDRIPQPFQTTTAAPSPTKMSAASSTPTATAALSATPSKSSSPSTTSTAMASVTPSVSVSPDASTTATATPSETPAASPSNSASASPSASPPAPRYVGAVMCMSGRSVFNVGVVDVDGELNIAMFAVTEETAMEYLDCIREDASSVSVEEYLEHAYNNCVGEDPEICRVNDLATGDCTCTQGQTPDRCVWRPYRRSVRRCDDV